MTDTDAITEALADALDEDCPYLTAGEIRDAVDVIAPVVAQYVEDAKAEWPEVEYSDDGERKWVRIIRQGVVVVQGYLEGPRIGTSPEYYSTRDSEGGTP